jgi:MPBQ/MSBQ methyltransferase
MFKKKNKPKPDLLLMFYREISSSDDLHFGYWNKNEELTMKNFIKAQERYFERFVSYIPKDVKTILDVGCGVGGNAKRLKALGYEITSLSPDPLLEAEFKKNTNNEIPFILTKFEDLKINKKFDMVLMSESLQYIGPSEGLKKCTEVLRPGGYLLGIDYFKIEELMTVEL